MGGFFLSSVYFLYIGRMNEAGASSLMLSDQAIHLFTIRALALLCFRCFRSTIYVTSFQMPLL